MTARQKVQASGEQNGKVKFKKIRERTTSIALGIFKFTSKYKICVKIC